MNFTQLRYFAVVARARNVTRASELLGVAQPALSRQIKLLEDELGTPLLHRQHRGVELTEAGALLLERAEFLTRTLDQTRSELLDKLSGPSGSLRVGCPPALTLPLMKSPLNEFITRFPRVSIQLHESISDQLRRAVLTDQLDLAVISTSYAEPSLDITPLFSEEVCLFGPARGGARAQRRMSLDKVSSMPLLLPRQTNATRDLLERRMADVGLRPNIVVETDSVQLIRHLVLQGVGYACAPRSALADDVRAGRMVGWPVERLTIARALARRSDRPVSRAAAAFVKLLDVEVETFRGLGSVRGRAGYRPPIRSQ